ncbi:MAG TPA: metallophosphoesterase [Gemmataceae bacterium]|nr:metallophosphoesterase [Gemmataceae bacterium]
MRIAITADLHWGATNHPRGDEASRRLVAFLERRPPDLLLIAGDVGAGPHFAPCLELFAGLGCRKALVPGNHDVWVTEDDPRGDSYRVYREHLPRLSAEYGFHYLDDGPLLLPEARLAVVGSMNWYDYSFAIEALRRRFPAELHRLQSKRFSRVQHNDANFVRWAFDDVGFTREVTAALERHLQNALKQVPKAIVTTHHPPFYGLGFPRLLPPLTMDSLLWDAFLGNRTAEELLAKHAASVPFAFCGHTHRARENTLAGVRGYNVGSDYDSKRLLLLDWPSGKVESHGF